MAAALRGECGGTCGACATAAPVYAVAASTRLSKGFTTAKRVLIPTEDLCTAGCSDARTESWGAAYTHECLSKDASR